MPERATLYNNVRTPLLRQIRLFCHRTWVETKFRARESYQNTFSGSIDLDNGYAFAGAVGAGRRPEIQPVNPNILLARSTSMPPLGGGGAAAAPPAMPGPGLAIVDNFLAKKIGAKVSKVGAALVLAMSTALGALTGYAAATSILFHVLPISALVTLGGWALPLMIAANALLGLTAGGLALWRLNRSVQKSENKVLEAAKQEVIQLFHSDIQDLANVLHAKKIAGESIQKVLRLFEGEDLNKIINLMDAITWTNTASVLLSNLQGGQQANVSTTIGEIDKRLRGLEGYNLNSSDIYTNLSNLNEKLKTVDRANQLAERCQTALTAGKTDEYSNLMVEVLGALKPLEDIGKDLEVLKRLQGIRVNLQIDLAKQIEEGYSKALNTFGGVVPADVDRYKQAFEAFKAKMDATLRTFDSSQSSYNDVEMFPKQIDKMLEAFTLIADCGRDMQALEGKTAVDIDQLKFRVNKLLDILKQLKPDMPIEAYWKDQLGKIATPPATPLTPSTPPATPPVLPAPPTAPPVPTIKGNLSTYTLDKKIGKGGMGEVWLGHNSAGNPVAIKSVLQEYLEQAVKAEADANKADPLETLANVLLRFEGEFRSGQTLNNLPGICGTIDTNIYEVFPNIKDAVKFRAAMDEHQAQKAGQIFIVFQFIPRVEGSLESAPKLEQEARKGMLEGRVIKLFLPLIESLASAHEKGVFHRDLNPKNIVITEDRKRNERLVVLDFGIAKDARRQTEITGPTQFPGSAFYTAPLPYLTLAKQNAENSRLIDIYQVGIVLLECLTGANPFRAMDLTVYNAFLAAPTTVDVSGIKGEEMQKIVASLLSPNPADNYPSMAKLLDDFKMLAGGTTPIKPEDLGYDPTRPSGVQAIDSGALPPSPPPAPAQPGKRPPLPPPRRAASVRPQAAPPPLTVPAPPAAGIDLGNQEAVIDFLSAISKKRSLTRAEFSAAQQTLSEIFDKWSEDEDIMDLYSAAQNKMTRLVSKGEVK